MLATLVIGLREGLEAALIVGIIAAFLKQNGRSDALRRMWVGVGLAVVLCLAVGLVLQAVNSSLPQRQQEMLECVVAAIAVVMVSYMVLWMRKHSRSLKSDLHRAAGGALANGSATALVLMAFLAVFREGFETAVFLLAAFQSAVSPAQAATGAVLGIIVAVGLGYLIYRGGVKLDLSKFFRITGAVLVLVAAGLVMSTFRAAYEAGWLTIGQQHAISLDLIARPGTVQESLLTGVLGIRSSMPVIEVVAYLLYLVPMLAVVLWPARRALTGPRLGRLLAGTAAAAVVVAGVLAMTAPAVPSSVRSDVLETRATTVATDLVTGAAAAPVVVAQSVRVSVAAGATTLSLAGAVSGTSTLTLSGSATVGGRSAALYAGTPISAPAGSTGLPATLTLRQVAALANGRLPIGLSSSAGAGTSVPASYTDTWTPTVTVDPATGTVLGLTIQSTRTVSVTGSASRVFPVGAVSAGSVSATPRAVDAQVEAARASADRRADAEVLGEVLPVLLAVFAGVLLAFAIPHLVRRRTTSTSPAPASPSPASPASSTPASTAPTSERPTSLTGSPTPASVTRAPAAVATGVPVPAVLGGGHERLSPVDVHQRS